VGATSGLPFITAGCRPYGAQKVISTACVPTAGSPWATGCRRYAACDNLDAVKLALMGQRPGSCSTRYWTIGCPRPLAWAVVSRPFGAHQMDLYLPSRLNHPIICRSQCAPSEVNKEQLNVA